MKTIKLENGMVITVVSPEEVSLVLTPEDKEMDSRVRFAVHAAIEKTQFLENLKRSKI